MEIKDKINKFIELAQLLFEKLDCMVLLYGLLSIEHLTQINLQSQTIQVLLPKHILEESKELEQLLLNNGYSFIDDHNWYITKDNVDFYFGSIEGLEDYVDISYSDFDIHYYNDVCYYSLSLSHYLHIFQTRYEDDKNQNDYNMIEFIQSYINKVDTTYFISDYFKGFLTH